MSTIVCMSMLLPEITKMETVNLLLPGFQGHQLQASVVGQENSATTYAVTCPTTIPANECGILGTGIIAISAPTSVEVINIDRNDNTASISCDVSGTTSAFCHAKETIFVKGTLAPKDLNWMDVPMATMRPNPDNTNAIGTFEGSAW
ncbi:hypothetical protein N7532_001430, partial [Penicillium argentinense]